MESGLERTCGSDYFCNCEMKTSYEENRNGVKITWLENGERKTLFFKQHIWWEEGEK
jgi:hypothetical protein